MSTDFINLLKHKTTHTVVIGDDIEIPVELPVNPVQGLGGRDDLKIGTGMLFTMDRTQTITMRGMKFSLDIVWIGANNKVVDISANTLLSVLNNDSLYTPKKPAKYALEINAGEAQKRGINIDDDVQINLLPNDSKFTRLIVLEKALDYLFKAQPGEQLEYLKPGENPPEGAQLQRGSRGGRGYYPSEVTGAEEESTLEPTEEREVSVVQAPESESTESVVSFEDTPPTDVKEIIAGLDEDAANYAAHGKEFISYLLDQIEAIREEVPSHKLQQLEVPFQRLQALEDQLAENKADLEPFYDAVLEYVDNIPWPVPIGSNRKKVYSELGLSIASDVYATHGPNHPLLRKIIDDFITEDGITNEASTSNARIPNFSSLRSLMDMAPASLLNEWYGGYSDVWIQSVEHTQRTLDSFAEKELGKPGPKAIRNELGALHIIGRRLRYQSELSDTVIEHFANQVDTFLTSGLKEGEKLLPPLDEWPEDFKRRFQNLHATTNPSTTIVLAIDELYKSTKFGLFHSISKEDWEEGSSTPYAGILKEAASRVLDGPIVFHNINVHDRDGNAAAIASDIEDSYERFSNESHVIPKDFVDSYMQVQKQLTSELLEVAFPGVEEFELFRGIDDSDLHNEIDPLEDEYDGWDVDDEDDDEESDEAKPDTIEEDSIEPDTSIPEFDSVFKNVTGKLSENPIASWSLDYKAASTNFAEDKDYGVVLRRKVSKDAIWASFLTHAYDGNEYEMIVIPNTKQFTLGAVFGGSGDGLDRGHKTAIDQWGFAKEGYAIEESLGVRGLGISNLFNPQTREGYEYRDFLQRIEHDERVKALKQDFNKADEDEVEDNDKKSKKINIEDNDNEDWIKEVRKNIEKTEKTKKTDNNLSKLLALETALEYLVKAQPGEKLEYLKPGENPPKGVQLQRGARGGRGYYPSEVREAKEEADVLEAPEEQEIEAVQAPALDEEAEWKKWQEGEYDDEEPDTEEQREADEEYDEDFINKLLGLEDEDSEEVQSVLDELFPDTDWDEINDLVEIDVEGMDDWREFLEGIKISKELSDEEAEAIAFEEEKDALRAKKALGNIGVEVGPSGAPRRLALADVADGADVADDIRGRIKYQPTIIKPGRTKKHQQIIDMQQERVDLYTGDNVLVKKGDIVKKGDVLISSADGKYPYLVAKIDGKVSAAYKYNVGTWHRMKMSYVQNDGVILELDLRAKDWEDAIQRFQEHISVQARNGEVDRDVLHEIAEKIRKADFKDFLFNNEGDDFWYQSDAAPTRAEQTAYIEILPPIGNYKKEPDVKEAAPSKKDLADFTEVLAQSFDGLNTDILFPNGRRYLSKHILKLLSNTAETSGNTKHHPIKVSAGRSSTVGQVFIEQDAWAKKHDIPINLVPQHTGAYYSKWDEGITYLGINADATGMDFNTFRKLSDWYNFDFLDAKDVGDGKAAVLFGEPQYEGHQPAGKDMSPDTRTGEILDGYEAIIDYKELLTRHHGAVIMHEFGHRIDNMISKIEAVNFTERDFNEEPTGWDDDMMYSADRHGFEGILGILFDANLVLPKIEETSMTTTKPARELSNYAQTNTHEYFAEAWTAYITDTFYLKARNPEAFEFFEALNTHDVTTPEGQQKFFDTLREKFPWDGQFAPYKDRRHAAQLAKYLDGIVLSKEDAEKRGKRTIAEQWDAYKIEGKPLPSLSGKRW